MPFTNSTSSGTIHRRPWVPGMSTRNCETTVKSLRQRVSQSMKLDPLVPPAIPARQPLHGDAR